MTTKSCTYCGGNCPNEPDDSGNLCDGYAGDIDGHEDTRARLIAQLAEGFSRERHHINAQGVGHLPDDLEQYAADLLDWCNVHEESHDPESLKLVFLFGSSLRLRAFDCGHCGDRCYEGHPDATDGEVDWSDFQGANQNEWYAVCDSCHMHSAEAREIEREYEKENGLA